MPDAEPDEGTDLAERVFDALMRASDTAMVVVAASDGSEVDACLVGFHCQCSIEPVRYAVWLSKANHTYAIATRSSALAVHWLRSEDHALAAAVGGVTLDDDPRKMERVAWHQDAQGHVRIDGAAGGFGGRIEHRHDDGDHECFVLTPTAAWLGEGSAAAAGGIQDVLRFGAVRDLDAGHSAGPADEG